MIAKVSYLTHFGNYRKTNEDSILLHDHKVKERHMLEPGYMVFQDEFLTFCVADGMGGHVHGELASDSVLGYIQENLNSFLNKKSILRTILKSKLHLNQIAIQENAYGLGTTLSGVTLKKNKVLVFNCGDSRVYKIQKDTVEKLTIDHSLVQTFYNSGLLDEEGMRNHPNKNILTSAIIGDLNTESPSIFYREVPFQIGTKFLLCTDGLWESLSTDELIQCLEGKKGIEETSQKLLDLSLAQGGKDNISYILFQIIDD
jgi:PPM family protein phosphatase